MWALLSYLMQTVHRNQCIRLKKSRLECNIVASNSYLTRPIWAKTLDNQGSETQLELHAFSAGSCPSKGHPIRIFKYFKYYCHWNDIRLNVYMLIVHYIISLQISYRVWCFGRYCYGVDPFVHRSLRICSQAKVSAVSWFFFRLYNIFHATAWGHNAGFVKGRV